MTGSVVESPSIHMENFRLFSSNLDRFLMESEDLPCSGYTLSWVFADPG